MRICHVVTSISRSAAGVSKAIIDLSEEMSLSGCDMKILTLEDPFSSVDVKHIKVPTIVCRRHLCSKFAFSFDLKKQIKKHPLPEIIHSHGLWRYPNYFSSHMARRLDIPHIVSSHGMCSPQALQIKVFRKKFVWNLVQRRILENADLLHATSMPEANFLRDLGLRNPIAVIANGVNLPEKKVRPAKPSTLKTVLFLSRIHPIKGIFNLVDAWAKLRPEGWQVIIAGPDEKNHMAEVKERIRNAKLEQYFKFTGPVYDDEKWNLYSRADIFVLPSFSENFGLVVAEALAAETPVITTTATPWSTLREHKCGWWVDCGVEPLVSALKDAMSLMDEQRQEMGASGRRLIEASYSWTEVAEQMSATYGWLIHGGGRPDFIFTCN